jgi:hypothetical protein
LYIGFGLRHATEEKVVFEKDAETGTFTCFCGNKESKTVKTFKTHIGKHEASPDAQGGKKRKEAESGNKEAEPAKRQRVDTEPRDMDVDLGPPAQNPRPLPVCHEAVLPPSSPPQPTPVASSLSSVPTGVLLQNDFLVHIDCRFHPMFKVIVCLSCNRAVPPAELRAHVKSHFENGYTGKNFFTLRVFSARLADTMEEFPVVDTVTDQLNPPPFLPEVEGLECHAGLLCAAEGCFYCCSEKKEAGGAGHSSTLDNHYLCHHKALGLSTGKRGTVCVMQRFNHNTSYFPVKPLPPSNPALYDLFKEKFVDSWPAQDNPSLSIEHDRDVPPLLTMTGWHLHLANFYESKADRESICNFVRLPKETEDYGAVPKLVLLYFSVVRDDAQLRGFEGLRPFANHPM